MAGVNVLNIFTIAYAYNYTTQPVLNSRVGSNKPIGDSSTEQGRQMNRRVEFTFIR